MPFNYACQGFDLPELTAVYILLGGWEGGCSHPVHNVVSHWLFTVENNKKESYLKSQRCLHSIIIFAAQSTGFFKMGQHKALDNDRSCWEA